MSGRWSQPLLSCSFYVDWAETEFIKEFIPNLRFSAISYIDGHAFVSAKDEEQYLNYLIALYKNGGLEDFSHRLDKVGQELYLKHQKFIDVHDDRKLDAIKGMLRSHLEFQSFWNFEAIGGDMLLKLAKKVGFIEFDAQLFDKVNPFLRKTWIEEEHDHVISIAHTIPADATNLKDLILNSKELIGQINEYLEKYSWIGTGNWQGEAYTIEVVIDKIIEEFQNLREDNNITISTNSSDVGEQDPIVQLSVITSYWRATCAGLTAKIENSYRSALRSLSENVGVAYEDLIFLTYKELEELITNPKAIIFDSKMKERKKEFFICKNDLEMFSVLVPSDAIYYHLKNSLIPNEFERVEVNELSGTGASGGIATGKAKIVFSRKDFNNFNEGEILIAPETTPAFVPIMRKAAAIITDRGGITSHAAIVGRELKKPVIIAVKNATKIIINDEALHVDAYKGIIKMTERTTNL